MTYKYSLKRASGLILLGDKATKSFGGNGKMKRALFFVLGAMLSSVLLMSNTAFAEDEDSKPAKRSIYYNLSPAFVTNFGRSEVKLAFVKAEVSLKVESEELLEKVQSNEPLLRHEIVMLLSSQTKEQMTAQDAQETIRKVALSRIKEALAEEVGKTGVQDLLFTSFVLQI